MMWLFQSSYWKKADDDDGNGDDMTMLKYLTKTS